ncbi:class 3 lipase protein [Aphelenchoides avenae]|nr:class 3 lipase protein [Aphelenchus avenae]KAH7723846.1 class 3 lipase protein [Aphelenchus avenae]
MKKHVRAQLRALSTMLRFVLGFALFGIVSAAYNDTFARNEMLFLSAAAYSLTPNLCLPKVLKSVQVDCGMTTFSGDCAAFVGVAPSRNAVFLAFRGTQGFVQLMVETGQTALTLKRASPAGGTVSSYFLDVFNKLWNGGLSAALTDAKAKYPDYELWVTGHSLGGALASIGAGVAAKQGIFPSGSIKLYTLGQPRTGDSAYANAINSLVPEAYRVVNSRDLVPHVPPYGLVGYKHHKNEVWYSFGMSSGARFQQCASDGFIGCSNPDALNVNVLDHINYFGKIIVTICPNTIPFSVFK